MKNSLILIVLAIFTLQISCKKTDDTLIPYAGLGIFKDMYPLDSVTIDLKQGNSVAIETNLGKLIITNHWVFNDCSIATSGYCDIGADVLLTLSLEGEKISIAHLLQPYIAQSLGKTYPVMSCNPSTIPNGPSEVGNFIKERLFLGENEVMPNAHFNTNEHYSMGNTTIQFRSMYPFAKDTEEADEFTKSKKYHAVFTFQRTCR